MRNVEDALALFDQYGRGLSRAGILDALDGGWLMIGIVPVNPVDKTAKWQFDPNQPRDIDGRWTDGAETLVSPTSDASSSPADIESLLEDIGYNGVFHDWLRDDLASYFASQGAIVIKKCHSLAWMVFR